MSIYVFDALWYWIACLTLVTFSCVLSLKINKESNDTELSDRKF